MWTVAAGVAVFASHRFLDVKLMEWSRWPGFNPVRPAFEFASQFGRMSWYVVLLGVLTPALILVGARHLSRRSMFALLSVLASGLAVQLLKAVAGRHRPKALVDDGLYGFSWFDFGYGTASFPSGHTATIAAVAAALWIIAPKWRDLWLIPVAAVAMARMLCGSHYLSDVIAGAYVGAATTFLVYRAFCWGGVIELGSGRSRPMTTSVSQSPVE
jgi:membrane-associated phospholipid phosphatase